MKISLVPEQFAHDVWPDIKGFMADAAAETNGRYEEDDVLDLIINYHYLLWIAFNDSGIKGAVVTCFNEYPRKKYLHLMFCGGEKHGGMAWKNEMLSVLRSWAKDNECDGIEGFGRLGWEKVFKDDGYTPSLRSFELPLGV